MRVLQRRVSPHPLASGGPRRRRGTADSRAGANYGGPTPSFPPRRSTNVVVAAAIGAVLLAGGSFLAGRLTAPNDTRPAAETGITPNGASAPGAAPSDPSTATSAVVSSTGFTVTDPAGDAVPHPTTDGKVYGPSDITNLSIRSDGTNLMITTVYTPSTPMNLISTETAIRLDPDAVPNCKASVLDSADWAVDYDAAGGGITVYKPGASCGGRYQSTSITGAANVAGSTLTIEVAQDSLGIRPGQRIVVRTSVSTRVDDHSTTFIQDWAPDGPSGTTGTV